MSISEIIHHGTVKVMLVLEQIPSGDDQGSSAYLEELDRNHVLLQRLVLAGPLGWGRSRKQRWLSTEGKVGTVYVQLYSLCPGSLTCL